MIVAVKLDPEKHCPKDHGYAVRFNFIYPVDWPIAQYFKDIILHDPMNTLRVIPRSYS